VPVLSWPLCVERSRERKFIPFDAAIVIYCQAPALVHIWSTHSSKATSNQTQSPTVSTTASNYGPPRPGPQSQSFSQSYRSILPTSLTYMLLVDERLFTLETCCGYGYDPARKSHSPSDFQGPTPAHQTAQEPRCSSDTISLSPDDPIPGSLRLMKKRQLFPGQVSASPSSLALPHVPHPKVGTISDAQFGNINPIPFRQVQ
jgi:hypothetical protein